MARVDTHYTNKPKVAAEYSGRRKIHQEDAFERYISRKVAALGLGPLT